MSMLVVYVTEDKKIFIIDGQFSQGTTPTEFREKVIEYCKLYPIDDVIIETIAMQQYLYADLSEQSMLGRLPSNVRILSHRHYTDKREHYRSYLEPFFNKSIVHINPGLKELIQEIEGKSEYEDALDCLSFMKEANLSFISEENEDDKIIELFGERGLKNKKLGEKLKKTNIFSNISRWG